MKYEIVRYCREFRQGVIDILAELTNAGAVLNEAYFKWKHEENPYSPDPIVYVARLDDQVVGMRAFMGARWVNPDNHSTSNWLCACDLVVHPEHRRRNLVYSIMNFALNDLGSQGFGHVLNWSANRITYHASLRSGWQLVAPYTVWGIETPGGRVVHLLNRSLQRMPALWRLAELPYTMAYGVGFRAMDDAWSTSVSDGALTFSNLPPIGDMSALVSRLGSTGQQHQRDMAYYQWRLGNPLSEYRFVCWRESQLEGFLVLRVSRGTASADVSIVDWDASSPEILDKLVSEVVKRGGYRRLSTWSVAFGRESRDRIRELGFTPVDTSYGDANFRTGLLMISPNGASAPPGDSAVFSSLDGWHLRPIYSDSF